MVQNEVAVYRKLQQCLGRGATGIRCHETPCALEVCVWHISAWQSEPDKNEIV